MTKAYDKPFLDYPQMIQHLQDDYGLIISNPDFATHALKTYSYYDLINGYKDCMMTDGKFKPGVSIENLCNLYIFDKQFQNILFTHIILLENYFKSVLAYQISKDFGVDESLYLDKSNYNFAHKNFDVPKLLSEIQATYKTQYPPIPTKHYVEKHNHIPAWILFKNISFGKSINLFRVMRSPQKNAIANELIPNSNLQQTQKIEYLISGLNLVRNCRNTVAHNLKFISFRRGAKESLSVPVLKKLVPAEFLRKGSSCPKIDNAGVYASLIFIYSLLNDNILKINFCRRICHSINNSPGVFNEYATALNMPTDLSQRLTAVIKRLSK